MTPAIGTVALRREYWSGRRATAAVDGLDLSISPGECYGLIGPNGAGKTTTIRMLAGLLEPTSGVILLNGLEPTLHRSETNRILGYVPDFFAVHEDLKVWEYFDYYGMAYDMRRAERQRRTGELIELFDLAVRRDDLVGTLSRGMKQRLCIAKTLMHDPAILLMDEPASGLDPKARIELREIIKTLRDLGKTIFISSHILAEMSDFCTSIGIMEKGRMVVSGRVEDILKRVRGAGGDYEARVTGRGDELLALLQQDPNVRDARLLDNTVRFLFLGDEVKAAALLASLVGTGLPVCGFTRQRSSLEDIFLSVAAHEVS
jgi:ABC-2 type transport system ATP-binding protein